MIVLNDSSHLPGEHTTKPTPPGEVELYLTRQLQNHMKEKEEASQSLYIAVNFTVGVNISNSCLLTPIIHVPACRWTY